jgi:uncharacterized membrane protein
MNTFGGVRVICCVFEQGWMELKMLLVNVVSQHKTYKKRENQG